MSENGSGNENDHVHRLLVRLKHGDVTAVDDLYPRFARTFYYTAINKGLTHNEAQEVVQTTFYKILRGVKNYDEVRGGNAGWMMSICIHAAVDVMRNRTPEQESLDKIIEDERLSVEEVDLAGPFQNEELFQALTEAWATLSPEDQEALRLGGRRGPKAKPWKLAVQHFHRAFDDALMNTPLEHQDELWHRRWHEAGEAAQLENIYHFLKHNIWGLVAAWESISPADQQELRRGRGGRPGRKMWLETARRYITVFLEFL
jgi:DNA-directed RNA polymerase specialized sigma24 family protein